MQTHAPETQTVAGGSAALALRDSIAAAGLTTQTAAAAALGITQGTVSVMLAGKVAVHPSYLLHLESIHRVQELEAENARLRALLNESRPGH